MKKTAVAVLVMTLLIMFAFSTFSSVFALTTTDHVNAYGSTIINISGHPQIIFDAYHIDSGQFGATDIFRIWYYTGLPSPVTYVPIAIFTTSSGRIAFFHELYGILPTSIQLVDSSAINVRREGKSLNIHAAWDTALEVPQETWGKTGQTFVLPAMTIPPGMLVFRGHGASVAGSSNSVPTYPGQLWSQTTTWIGYFGDATFVCPTWDFGGPVGIDEGAYRTSIRTDETISSTHI